MSNRNQINQSTILGFLATNRPLVVAVAWAVMVMAVPPAIAQPGWVQSHQKISDTQGGFTGTLGDSDAFGSSTATAAATWRWGQFLMTTGVPTAGQFGCCSSTPTGR